MIHSKITRNAFAILLIASLNLLGGRASAQNLPPLEVDIEVVAITYSDGALGPGLGEGASFNNNLGRAQINGSGTVMFEGSWSSSVSGSRLRYLYDGSGISPIAMLQTSGELGPNLDDLVFKGFGRGVLDDDGNVTTLGHLDVDSSITETGLWRIEQGQRPRMVARSGVEGEFGPPFGPGIQYNGFIPHLNRFGVGVVRCGLRGNNLTVLNEGRDVLGNAIFFWDGSEMTPAIVADHDGDYGPGLGQDITFAPNESFGGSPWTRVAFGKSGDFIGEFQLAGPGITVGINHSAIYHVSPENGIRQVIRWGDPMEAMEGIPQGSTFEFLKEVSTSSEGITIMNVIFRDPNLGRVSALLEWDGDSLKLLYRGGTDGEYGPGLGAGIRFSQSRAGFEHVAITGEGHIVFKSHFPNGSVWFRRTPAGLLQPVFMNQRATFNLPPSFVAPARLGITGADWFHGVDRHQLNSRGDVAIIGVATDDSGDAINPVIPKGAFVSANGRYARVLNKGDEIDVDPSEEDVDLRVVKEVKFPQNYLPPGIDSNELRFFNDNRQMVLEVEFEDADGDRFTQERGIIRATVSDPLEGLPVISGRVFRPYIPSSRDPDRRYRPLPNARVVARSGGRIVATTFSGARGEYAFEPFPVGVYEISAVGIGYEQRTKEVRVTPEHLLSGFDVFPEGLTVQHINLLLMKPDPAPPIQVTGTVVDGTDGFPIGNVRFFALVGDQTDIAVYSDLEGEYELGIPVVDLPNMVMIQVEVPGYAAYEAMLDVTESSMLTHDIVLTREDVPRGSISGEVVNAQTGLPIEGALVNIVNLDSKIWFEATTAADGSYVHAGLPAGSFYRMAASALSYRPWAADTAVEADTTSQVAFQLQPDPNGESDTLTATQPASEDGSAAVIVSWPYHWNNPVLERSQDMDTWVPVEDITGNSHTVPADGAMEYFRVRYEP